MKSITLLNKIGFAVSFMIFSLQVQASIYPVNSVADAGAGTLRQAILDINIAPQGTFASPYIIDMSAIDGQTISLKADLPEIKNFVQITAVNNVTISGQSLYRAFFTQMPEIVVWYNHITVVKAKTAFVNLGASVYLDHCTATGCSSNTTLLNGGGMFNNGYAECSRCSFTTCSAPNSAGGGICNFSAGVVILNDSSEVSGCTAQNGGGIYNLGKMILKGGTNIKSNTAVEFGGGVFTNSSLATVSIDNCLISRNSAGGGGGIYALQNLNISNVTRITKNSSTTNGGGVFITAGSNVLFDASFIEISYNTAVQNGGGLFFDVNNNTKLLTSIAFENNTASQNGGGVYSSNGFMVISGGTFKSNTAAQNGGAMYSGAALYMTGVQLSNNKSTSQNGGALFINNTDVTIANGCYFGNNKASNGKGAAIFNGTGLLNIAASSFTGNTGVDGAVVYSIAPNTKPVNIDSATVTGNTSSGYGCFSTEDGIIQINGSTLNANSGLLVTNKSLAHFIYNINGKYIINNTGIQNNTNACITKSSNADVIFNTCNVVGNSGVFSLGTGNYNFSSSLFDNNERIAMDYSRGISGHVNLLNCTFQNNRKGLLYCIGGDSSYSIIADSCIIQNNADTVTLNRSLNSSGVLVFQQANTFFNHCLFNGNAAPTFTGSGGVINCIYGSTKGVNVLNSTFSNNTANTGYGGAIRAYSNASLTLNNCTFSGNKAYGNGGAISSTMYGFSGAGGKANININSCTFVLNRISSSYVTALGGAIWNDSGKVDISNTIIAGNIRGGGITDDIVSGSRIRSQFKKNLFTTLNASIVGGAYNTVSSAAEVVNTSLNYNGGFTPTHLLTINSPALDFCLNGTTLSIDQRGAVRDLFPDCGSVEGSFPIGKSAPTSISNVQITKKLSLSVFPNPAVNTATISFNNIKQNESVIIITDMNGKTVYSSNQKTVAGINNIRIDISKLSAGSYLIGLLASDGEMQTIKFIKE